MMSPDNLIVFASVLAAAFTGVQSWLVPQPKINVWTTLAKTLGQDGLCLAMRRAEDPMSTCLIGIPLQKGEISFVGSYTSYPDPVSTWDDWVEKLPGTHSEPQELDLLGSTRAVFCVNFWSFPQYYLEVKKGDKENDELEVMPFLWVNTKEEAYLSPSWCDFTAPGKSRYSGAPKKLPKGIFLICGNRAWAGIPACIWGGPCTLGKLVTFTPDKAQLLNWKNSAQLARPKREIVNVDEKCDSTIMTWPKSKWIADSILVPWVATMKKLGDINKIECWLGEHSQLSSAALSQLLQDEETVKHATLQNRAAIDYLLLAQGHGCKEFEGMCCFNFSTHGQSMASKISEIQNNIDKLQTQTKDWLSNIFEGWGLSGRAGSILKSVLWVLFSVILMILVLIVFNSPFVKKKRGDIAVRLAQMSLEAEIPDKAPWV